MDKIKIQKMISDLYLFRLTVYFVWITLIILFATCSDKEIYQELSLSFSQESVAVAAEGGIKTIEVTANGDWVVSNVPDWCTIQPEKGSSGKTTVYISVKPRNESEKDCYSDRTATLKFGNKDFTIIQKKIGALLLSANKFNVSAEGDTISVEIQHNVNFCIKIEPGAEEWISQIETGKVRALSTTELYFEIKPSNSTLPREGKIVISDMDNPIHSDTIEVHQAAAAVFSGSSGYRALIAVYNGLNTAQNKGNRKVLISWRSLPGDPADIAFDLWRISGNGEPIKINSTPISGRTNYQDNTADISVTNTYLLKFSGQAETIGQYIFTPENASKPYLSIPINNSELPDPSLVYIVRDAAVGDLDGDGILDIVIRRDVDPRDIGTTWNGYQKGSTILQGYKFDGTYLWTVDLGININQGEHTTPFIVYDFNNDGRAEVAVRTSELTKFGNGTIIQGNDYRSADGRVNDGPEYLSIIDGITGTELARTNYIARGNISDWGDNYGNRANRFLMGVGYLNGTTPSIIMCRGYYAKTVIEAWDFSGNSLTKRWNFTAIPNGQNAAYAGQGNHSIAVADVDRDGKDEIIYGSCTIDDNGVGLYSSGLGHGDALHIGKFDSDRSGLQIFSCFESGTIQVALRDAANGSIIWRVDGTSNNDTGRCLTADIDPTSRGYEMWHSGNTGSIYAVDGTVLGKPLPTTAGGGVTYNLAIWWTGSLNRQLLDKATITSYTEGRIFTGGYDGLSVSTTNKEGLPFYGDIIGDWREEMIYAHNVGGIPVELRVFTTDYPCNYKFPYLMSNRHYRLSAAHQNIGYNQPTQIDYYIGSDLK